MESAVTCGLVAFQLWPLEALTLGREWLRCAEGDTQTAGHLERARAVSRDRDSLR